MRKFSKSPHKRKPGVPIVKQIPTVNKVLSGTAPGLSTTALPAGVTLQAIDGETMTSSTTMSLNYFSRNNFTYGTNASVMNGTGIWSEGMTWDDPRFYPIGCFYGLYTDTLTQFLDLNLNVSIAVTADSNMTTVANAGVWTICRLDR